MIRFPDGLFFHRIFIHKKQFDLYRGDPFFSDNKQARPGGSGGRMRALQCVEPGNLVVINRREPAPCGDKLLQNPFLNHRLADIVVNHGSTKQRRFGGLISLVNANDVGVKQPRWTSALGSGVACDDAG
jgi:hypothetical protein